MIRAADHLATLLAGQGATRVFGVPGESFLPVLDALRDGPVRFVTCRQEGGAAMAADAHARLTGRPGICMVTRGPGATNAAAGIHVAAQDSTPLIVFVGQVARGMRGREAFQELDYPAVFGSICKWAAEIDDASRMQEMVCRAYRVALSGRPGPVVLALPEDMLYEEVSPPPAPAFIEPPRYAPTPEALEAFRERLAAAKRPLVIAGGGGWTARGRAALARFASSQDLPVAVSFRSQGLMDNAHPSYVGHLAVAPTPYLRDAIAEADLLIALGARLGEITTQGYAHPAPPVPAAPLVHVFPEPEEMGRAYEPAIALASDTQSFCEAVAGWDRLGDPETRADLRAAYEDHASPASVPDDPLAPIFAQLAKALPEGTVLCNGAGNYAAWLQRFHRYREGTQLAPTSGSMGYGLPAAIAAALEGRPAVAVAGDGCFMMTCQEMATAVQEGLSLTVIVVDNGRLGTIRAHQEREHPGRVASTELRSPDFAALARSMGAHGETATDAASFRDALGACLKARGVGLVHLAQDRDWIAPGRRL